MTHFRPQDVTSPQAHWQPDHVVLLDDGPASVAIAFGVWDKRSALVIRWNGNDERPLGNPQSSSHPTWFLLPRFLALAVAQVLAQMQVTGYKGIDANGLRAALDWLHGEPPLGEEPDDDA